MIYKEQQSVVILFVTYKKIREQLINMALQYYSLVVGGSKVHNQLLHGRAQKKNKKGEPLFGKDGSKWLEYINLHEASTRAVVEFSTQKAILDSTHKDVKAVFNELKTLLKNCKLFYVVYHPSTDKCSSCDFNHYHIVLAKNIPIDLNHEYRYRAMKRATTTGNEVYVKSQKVKNLEQLIKYLSRKPRILYGTNCKEFIQYYREEQGAEVPTDEDSDFIQDCEIESIIGEAEEEVADFGFGPIDLPIDSEFDTPTESKKRTADDEFQSIDPDDLPTAKKAKLEGGQPNEKGNIIPKLINTMAFIMQSTRATDTTKMRYTLDLRVMQKPSDHGSKNMIAKLKTIMFHREHRNIWTAAKAEYRSRTLIMSFKALCKWAWVSIKNDPRRNDVYIPLEDSVQLLVEWIEMSGQPVKGFLTNLYEVLNSTKGKGNTVFCQGISNAGKTVMFARPIEYIMCNVGAIVSVNTTSRFIFECCAGQRLISIEECEIPKQHMQELKKIMGGEPCHVDVKFINEGIELPKIPVIATSNKEPWYLDCTEELPLRNRMYYYQFPLPFDKLADWINYSLDPRAYIVLWESIKRNISIDSLFDDTVLRSIIAKIDALCLPTIDKSDDIYSYNIYTEGEFKFKEKNVVAYLYNVPVVYPEFDNNECKQYPVFKYIRQRLLTEPSDFWLRESVIIDTCRIIIRFSNCAIGACVGCHLIEDPVINCSFGRELRRFPVMSMPTKALCIGEADTSVIRSFPERKTYIDNYWNNKDTNDIRMLIEDFD